MDNISTYLGLAGSFVAASMWLVHTVRHRIHLSQCVQDLQRQRRLDRRLIGCVTEAEWILDDLPAVVNADHIPEVLVGHARYLFALRQEAGDNAARLSRHAVRLSWPDGYLGRATLAGKRCELAHGALVKAFQAISDAAREYEKGLGHALSESGNGAAARRLDSPVRLLDEHSAAEVARIRDACGEALTNAADACKFEFSSHIVFETKWPVRRSEIAEPGSDLYYGEVRPMGWTGFGAQPLLHVDAR